MFSCRSSSLDVTPFGTVKGTLRRLAKSMVCPTVRVGKNNSSSVFMTIWPPYRLASLASMDP
jgi:hypothetical protein